MVKDYRPRVHQLNYLVFKVIAKGLTEKFKKVMPSIITDSEFILRREDKFWIQSLLLKRW